MDENIRLVLGAETSELTRLRNDLKEMQDDLEELKSLDEARAEAYEKLKKDIIESGKAEKKINEELIQLEEARKEAILERGNEIDKAAKAMRQSGQSEKEISKELLKIEAERGFGINDITRKIEEKARAAKKSGASEEEVNKKLVAAEEKYKKASEASDAAAKAKEKSIKTLTAEIKKYETSQTSLRSELTKTRNEMGSMRMLGQENSDRFQELANKAAQLQTQINYTNQEIKGLSSSSQFLSGALGVGQGLTGSFTMATSAMALFGGESEELQKAFFKVQAALQVLNGFQMMNNVLMKTSTQNVALRNMISKLFSGNIAKEAAATTANTAATGAATVATRAWNTALLANPIFWMVAAIMGVIGAITGLISIFKKQKETQEQLNELEKLRLERLERTTNEIKKNTEARVKSLQRELDLLQSLGASEEMLSDKRREILQTQLDGALQVNKEQQSNIDALDENIKRQKELKKALDDIDEASKKGNKYVKIEAQIEGLDRDVQLSGIFKNEKEIRKQIEDELSNLDVNITGAEVSEEALKAASNKLDVYNNEESKKNRDRALKDAVIMAQIRLDETNRGSEKELQARLRVIEMEKAESLSKIFLSEAERMKIIKDSEKKIAEARAEYDKFQLTDQKTLIEAKIAMAKEGSLDEFQLRKELLLQQYEIEISNEKLTLNEREKLHQDYIRNLQKMDDDFNKKAISDDLNTQIAMINASMYELEKSAETELELKNLLLEKKIAAERKMIEATITDEALKNEKLTALDAMLISEKEKNNQEYEAQRLDTTRGNAEIELNLRRMLLEKQAELERQNIEASIMNEELKAAKILEINVKLNDDLLKIQQDYEQKRIDAALRSAHIELEAERLKNEEIMVSGNFFQKMKARNELMQHELKCIQSEQDALDTQFSKGLISAEEYHLQRRELENAESEARINIMKEEAEAIKEIQQQMFDFAVSLFSSQFDHEKALLQQRLSDLKEFYTTDEKEAQENADKQLITKEELARREKEIKKQIAQAEQKKAIFEATINAISGVVKALSSAPPPYNLVLAAITAAATAAQIAQIKSQKLPGFFKGKKRKEKDDGGQWANVGEMGKELMWNDGEWTWLTKGKTFVPHDAAIIPAAKSKNVTEDVMREFNIPVPEMPKFKMYDVAIPNIQIPEGYLVRDRREPFKIDYRRLKFDYQKLGRAVASNIPDIKQLSVNLDERGFSKHLTTGKVVIKSMNLN